MDHSQFGVKIYKNATYKGMINEENKREGYGVLIHNTSGIYEGEWLKDKKNGQGF